MTDLSGQSIHHQGRSRRREQLTLREMQVLVHAAHGASIDQTAAAMRLTSDTVKTYRKMILVKTRAENITHAVYLERRKIEKQKYPLLSDPEKGYSNEYTQIGE